MQKTKTEIIPHYESHWGTQNQMRLEKYPQCATQCATHWDSQNHMKRAIGCKSFPQKKLEFQRIPAMALIWSKRHLFAPRDPASDPYIGTIVTKTRGPNLAPVAHEDLCNQDVISY